MLFAKSACLVAAAMLLAEMVIEIGPTLATVMATFITSLFSLLASTLAYKYAYAAKQDAVVIKDDLKATDQKRTGELKEIHTAVNSNNERLTTDLKDTKAELLRISKLLVEAREPRADAGPQPVHIVQPEGEPVPVSVQKPGTQ